MTKANLTKVKVYPKDFKSIPDILPYNKLLHGDPVELELDKKEILRCMNFGDVYDITSGEEVLIDEVTFHDIVEFVEEEDEDKTEEPTDPGKTDPEPSKPTEGDQTDDKEKDPSQEVTDPDTSKDKEETPSSEGDESTDPAAGTDSEQNANEVSTQDLDASEAVVKKSSRKKAVVEE